MIIEFCQNPIYESHSSLLPPAGMMMVMVVVVTMNYNYDLGKHTLLTFLKLTIASNLEPSICLHVWRLDSILSLTIFIARILEIALVSFRKP